MISQEILTRISAGLASAPRDQQCLGSLVLAVQAELYGSGCNRLSESEHDAVSRFYDHLRTDDRPTARAA
jgi:hypothetical protein